MTSKSNLTKQRITPTTRKCAIGEKVGKSAIDEQKIPVLSCEGACIRGEIARQAANMLSKESPFGRACHGELITVPESAIAQWVKTADKVVLIDGCFLRCHGRILEHLVDEDALIEFDALTVHRKYTDVFDPDEVPECERLAVARQVADHVQTRMNARQEPTCCDDKTPVCCGS